MLNIFCLFHDWTIGLELVQCYCNAMARVFMLWVKLGDRNNKAGWCVIDNCTCSLRFATGCWVIFDFYDIFEGNRLTILSIAYVAVVVYVWNVNILMRLTGIFMTTYVLFYINTRICKMPLHRKYSGAPYNSQLQNAWSNNRLCRELYVTN